MNHKTDIIAFMRECSEEQKNTPFFTIVPQDMINYLMMDSISKETFIKHIKYLPIMRNPRMREVMVICSCDQSYVTYLPDDTYSRPIPDVPEDSDIICPHCKASIHEWRTMQGHSGGHFNATRHRDWYFVKGAWTAPPM